MRCDIYAAIFGFLNSKHPLAPCTDIGPQRNETDSSEVGTPHKLNLQLEYGVLLEIWGVLLFFFFQ